MVVAPGVSKSLVAIISLTQQMIVENRMADYGLVAPRLTNASGRWPGLHGISKSVLDIAEYYSKRS